ncbi:MAG TPA: cupredoxin domain-containing protein [Terriglobia bacterium]|jgi:plastocyanin|nr:cupredoxin domain-containing protein [Terriglobia bacterium]
MRQLKIGVGLLLFALVSGPALRAQMMDQVVPGQVRVFKITIREKGAAEGINPFLVIVRPQDKVQFVLTSVDGDCSFAVKDLHVRQKLKKGVPATLNFTAPDDGKFNFACSGGMIGMHRDLKGTLVVKQNAPMEGSAAASSATPQ